MTVADDSLLLGQFRGKVVGGVVVKLAAEARDLA